VATVLVAGDAVDTPPTAVAVAVCWATGCTRTCDTVPWNVSPGYASTEKVAASLAETETKVEQVAAQNVMEYASPEYKNYRKVFEQGFGQDRYFAFNGAYVVVPQPRHLIDPGSVDRAGWKIRNWDGKANGVQSMTEVLIHSSNVGMVWVSDRLGADRFYKYVDAFGFGQPSRVGLSGEAPGLFRRPGGSEWQPIDLATNSFGQAIQVTPLQVTAMMSTATSTMLSAMAASTGGRGTSTKPSVAAANVMLCATVNAVTVSATRRQFPIRITSAKTNSR